MEKNKIMNFKDLEAWKQAHVFASMLYLHTKYLIPITLSLILYTFPSIPFADAAILTKPANNLGLVGYWNFNEGTSTYAGDFSANSNTGTLTNMANPPTAISGWGNGKFDGGLNFDGTDDYVSVPDQNYFSPSVNDVTVSFWAKIETNATPGDDNICGATGDYLIAKGITGQWEWGFENDGNDRFCMTLWQSGGSNHMSIGVLRTMNDGKWHHYVGVMDYLMQYTIYVDGISVGTTGVYTGTMDNGTQPVEIGRRGIGDNAQATIDDVRVFGRALSASEVTALYKSGGARFGASSADLQQGTTLANGIVGHWTFDGKDTTNTTATDVSGQNNNGTFTNFTRATNATAGKLGQALNFDNVNDYISIPANSSLQIIGDVTVAVNIKISSGASGTGSIISQAAGGELETGNLMYALHIPTAGNGTTDIEWHHEYGAGNNTIVSFNTNLSFNTWYNIVAVRNDTTKTVALYIDGILFQSQSYTNSATGGSSTSMAIGQSLAGSGHWFDGLIDDPRIYNRALSAEEIKQLYNLGSAKAQASSVTLQQGTTLANGLVGHWTFDGKDTTNTTATDLSGQNNTGTFTNFTRATNAKAGKLGQGMSFDGTNDYVNIADQNYFSQSVNSLTVSFWANIPKNAVPGDSNGCGGSGDNLIGKMAASNAEWGFENDGNDRICFSSYALGGFGHAEVNVLRTMNDGSWHHYVGTMNDLVRQELYIDGVLLAITTSYANSAGNGTAPVTIGQRGDGNYGNALIDDVRIYNRALSASEVKQLYLMGR